MIQPAWIIQKKRDGEELSPAEIKGFIQAVCSDEAADYQTTAFLMATYFKGMTSEETADFVSLMQHEREAKYSYGDLNRFPVYFGTHPAVMKERIARHPLSQEDLTEVNRRFWWYPPKVLRIRYKTGRRVREKIF